MHDVREYQLRLKTLGYYDGAIDGKHGPKTKAALRKYQIAKGLGVDGLYGPNTDAKLFPPTLIPDREGGEEYQPSLHIIPNFPHEREVMKYYGGVGLNQTTLILPFPMRIAWDLKLNITKFSIHEKVHDSAKRCFERVADAYGERQRKDLGLDLFGGCLNVRVKRGGSTYSMHAWGIAIDFDPVRNQLTWNKSRARLGKDDAVTFWKIWEEENWVSLGRKQDRDWMHVQAARI